MGTSFKKNLLCHVVEQVVDCIFGQLAALFAMLPVKVADSAWLDLALGFRPGQFGNVAWESERRNACQNPCPLNILPAPSDDF